MTLPPGWLMVCWDALHNARQAVEDDHDYGSCACCCWDCGELIHQLAIEEKP